MEIFLVILRNTVRVFLAAIELAMFLRAILSWFFVEDSRLGDFLYAVTEPAILPVRLLFEKLGWFQNMPIDISFFVTFLLLSVVGSVL